MDINYETALEVASHEAVIRKAYKDSKGVWTWSVGLTSKSGHKVQRYIDNPQSLERCLEVYVWALGNYAEEVEEVFKDYKITRKQFTAALSFHWNTGSIAEANWVDLWKDGEGAKSYDAFMNWSSPKAIIPRRKKERELFFNGTWSNNGTMTEYTRLTSNYTPVWSSAKTVEVEGILKGLLGSEEPQEKEPVKVPSSAEDKLERIRLILEE